MSENRSGTVSAASALWVRGRSCRFIAGDAERGTGRRPPSRRSGAMADRPFPKGGLQSSACTMAAVPQPSVRFHERSRSFPSVPRISRRWIPSSVRPFCTVPSTARRLSRSPWPGTGRRVGVSPCVQRSCRKRIPTPRRPTASLSTGSRSFFCGPGSWRIHVAGPAALAESLRRHYADDATGRFDSEVIGKKIYDHAIEVVTVSSRTLFRPRGPRRPVGTAPRRLPHRIRPRRQ